MTMERRKWETTSFCLMSHWAFLHHCPSQPLSPAEATTERRGQAKLSISDQIRAHQHTTLLFFCLFVTVDAAGWLLGWLLMPVCWSCWCFRCFVVVAVVVVYHLLLLQRCLGLYAACCTPLYLMAMAMVMVTAEVILSSYLNEDYI